MLGWIPWIRKKIEEENRVEEEFAKEHRCLEDGLFNQNEPGTLTTPKWLRRALKCLRYLSTPLVASALAVGVVDHNRVATFWLCAVAFLALSACSSHAAFEMSKDRRQHWAVFFLVTTCGIPVIIMTTMAAFKNQTAFALSNISGNVVLVMCVGIGLSFLGFDLHFKRTDGYKDSQRGEQEAIRRYIRDNLDYIPPRPDGNEYGGNEHEELEMQRAQDSELILSRHDVLAQKTSKLSEEERKARTDRRGFCLREPKHWEAGMDRYGTVFIAALIFVFMGPLAKAIQLLASSLDTPRQHDTYHAALASTVMGAALSISLYVVDQLYRIIHPIDSRRHSGKIAWYRSTNAALDLVVSGALMGGLAYLVVRSLDEATASMNVSPIFSGWLITPLFNTFPILLTMVLSAMEGDLTFTIEIGCALALQQLLLALPFIISISWIHGNTAIALVDPALAFAIITGYLVSRMSMSKMRPTYADGIFLVVVWLAWANFFFFFYPVIGIFFTGLTGPTI